MCIRDSTYTLHVYDGAGVRKKAVSGLTGNTWAWETEEADCGGLLEQLSIELFSVRDGYESWQRWRWAFRRPPSNLLLPSLLPATATGGGISVTIHEDGTVTLDGTGTVLSLIHIFLKPQPEFSNLHRPSNLFCRCSSRILGLRRLPPLEP